MFSVNQMNTVLAQPGFLQVTSTCRNGAQFLIVEQNVNFDEAIASCSDRNGTLASIKNQEEFDDIEAAIATTSPAFFKRFLWFGMF